MHAHDICYNAWSAKHHLHRFGKYQLCDRLTFSKQIFAAVFKKYWKWELSEILPYVLAGGLPIH